MESLFEKHADICKTFANSKRLEIINALRDKEITASELVDLTKISKANLSQHMSILVQKGVVLSRRESINVYYRIADHRIIKACELMREVLISKLEKDAKILKKIKE